MTRTIESAHSSADRIGWDGDYFTAPELSPVLAKTLVRQVLEIDGQLEHPEPFTLVEVGAGNGTFALDFLQECQMQAPGFFDRLSYQIVERSPWLRKRQAMRLQHELGTLTEKRLSWTSSLDELEAHSLTGVVFSNELVDALPVHRVRWRDNHLQELCVTYREGGFVEYPTAHFPARLLEYMDTHHISLRADQITELHLEAEAWIQRVARLLQRGVVITIDYGHTAHDYYGSDRPSGTLLCYHRHAISHDPFARIGEQDITAHVNFSALAESGATQGLALAGLTTLAHWLMGLDVETVMRDQDPESQEVQALAELLRPHGMGKTFKVLVQQKGMTPFSMQGLRYPAFFEDALFKHRA